MSNWWTFGETAATDNYEDLPPPTARITVRPRLPSDFAPSETTDEDRRLAEYAASLVRSPRRNEPSPIEPSIYDTQQFTLRSPQAAPPREMGGGAEARSIQPTRREVAAQRLLGDAPSATRRRIVSTLMGTTGIGESGVGAVDFVPFVGSALGAQEEAQKGDYQMAAVNAMPGGKPIRKALKAAVEGATSPVTKAIERNVGFAPGSVAEAPDVSAAAPYIINPVRVANPGVYKRPDVIAREAAENVAPEHPALKELFGVTRDDLYQISQQGRRQGNIEPEIWMPGRPGKVNYAAEAIMTPANARRMVDTLSEAEKYPELIKGMDPWYVMDPMYNELVRLFGKKQAAAEYVKLNATIGPFSAGSNVLTEINRGTAANMAVTRGDYPTFQRFAGVAEKDRGADFPDWLRDVKGHAYHGIQARPVASWMETGKHAYENDTVKIPLYMQASGVPETGFQTRLPVPDAHFTRASGMPDARRQQAFNEYMGGTEYRPYGSWFRENVAKPLGIEAVPAQARMWGTYAPQTGVDTAIGAGKLELISQAIWDRAKKLGIDPRVLRDQVLRGKAHATLAGGGTIGGVAAMDEYDRD